MVLVASKNSRSAGVEEKPRSAKGKADTSKVTRDDHSVRGEIKTAVPFVVSGVSQEDT